MNKNKTVSLCMIVKNEEKHLKRCLESVKSFVDEMIIIDTGSSDQTVKIAEELGANVDFFKWNEDFGEARNYSLQGAKMDWILLMDGDDEFHPDDVSKFLDLINNSTKDGHYFKTLSYAGNYPGRDIITNLNLRLLRNNKKYAFSGAIHEQITCTQGPMDYRNFTTEDIRIFHYGYLNSVAAEKNKRNRNIAIIEKELAKDPYNGFHYFNLGNEYFALGDLKKALELYDKVYNKIDFNIGFASKLVFKRILCLDDLKKYDEALTAIEEGLHAYPQFTDLEFERGWNHLKNKRYTLAIDSFNRCLEMGNPPLQLEFMEGCGTFRSCEALGEIYYELQDYAKALSWFENTLKYNPYLQKPLYKIGKILNKQYEDKLYVSYRLSQYFNLEHVPNLLLIANIFINESLYEIAKGYLEKAKELEENNVQIIYLTGRVYFYQKAYTEALGYFLKIPRKSEEFKESLRYIFLSEILIRNEYKDTTFFEDMPYMDPLVKKVYLQLISIYRLQNETILTKDEDQTLVLKTIMPILGELLKAQEFKLFEVFLNILNYVDSNQVLLELAKLYYDHGYGQMAVFEVLRSIKEFHTLDTKGAEILYKETR